MRVAIISLAAGKSGKLDILSQALGKGLEAAGHRVEFFAAQVDPRVIGSFDYIVVGTESAGPWGRLPPVVADYIHRCVGLGGKRSFAFVRKSGLLSSRLLSRLMGLLEGEGMRLTYSEILSAPGEANKAGREAPVERA